MKRALIVLFCSASLLACAGRVAESEHRRVRTSSVAEADEARHGKKELEGEEGKGPSWALLRKFAAGHAPDLVSERRPVVFVTVGPQGGNADGDPHVDVDEGSLRCRDDARKHAAQAIKQIWADRDPSFDLDQLSPCQALSCTKPAQGEWDDEVHFTFVRTGDDRVALKSVVRVLDVPVRIGADEDRVKAMKKAAVLEAMETCPGYATGKRDQ